MSLLLERKNKRVVLIITIIYLSALIYLLAKYFSLFDGIVETTARQAPIGRDFTFFWAGGVLASNLDMNTLYDPAAFENFMIGKFEGVVPPEFFDTYNFSYPPSILLLLFPFGFLDYIPALIVFTLTGLLLYWRAVQYALQSKLFTLIGLIAPAVSICCVSGQNGLIIAALFISGWTLVQRKHFIIAGVCFGLLTFKPQLGILIPFALIFGSHWKTFFSAAATTVTCFIITLIFFGVESWESFFLNGLAHQASGLEAINTQSSFMIPTVYKSIILIGGTPTLAFTLQFLLFLTCLIVVFQVFRRDFYKPALKLSILCVLSSLATPYIAIYDLTLLTFAAIAFAHYKYALGSLLSSDIYIITIVLLCPVFHLLFSLIGAPIGPIIIMAFAVFLLREAGIWGQNQENH